MSTSTRTVGVRGHRLEPGRLSGSISLSEVSLLFVSLCLTQAMFSADSNPGPGLIEQPRAPRASGSKPPAKPPASGTIQPGGTTTRHRHPVGVTDTSHSGQQPTPRVPLPASGADIFGSQGGRPHMPPPQAREAKGYLRHLLQNHPVTSDVNDRPVWGTGPQGGSISGPTSRSRVPPLRRPEAGPAPARTRGQSHGAMFDALLLATAMSSSEHSPVSSWDSYSA